MALSKLPEAGSLGQPGPGGGDRAPSVAGLVSLVGVFPDWVAVDVEPPMCSLLFVAAGPGNETLGALESGLLPGIGPLTTMKNNSKNHESLERPTDPHARRTMLWLSAIILFAVGIAAWSWYVDPDKGYNRFDQYGWSWQVLGSLTVILAFVAVTVFALWLILRRL